MQTVKISPKFQVVIPEKVRENMHLNPGERLAVIEKDNVIHLIPVGPISKLRGIAKNVDTKNLREKYERLS